MTRYHLPSSWRSATILILFVAFGAIYNLPAQTLKLKFGFEDIGPTTSDSVAGAVLNLVNAAGTAADMHGGAGSGVGGAGKAMDLTFAGTHGGSGGGGALVTASSAVNFGTVSNFSMTFWLKPSVALNGNPRFYFLGVNGTADINTTNTMGIQGNQTGSSTSDQTFLHAFNNTFNGLTNAMLANQWSFVAFTYDGTNMAVYCAGESNIVGTPVLNFRTNLTMAVGSSFRMYLGNNNARNRSFNGLMDDVRFYTGAGSPAFLESVRVSGLPDPFPVATTITPPVTGPGGTVVITGNAFGTAPISYQWLFTDTNGISSLVANATNTTLTLTNIQLSNAGSYSLIVSNNPGGIPTVKTNAPATLIVRPPNSVTWIGSAGSPWDTTTINWDSDGNGVADTNYFTGDNVRFDDAGALSGFVTIESLLTPSRVVVSNTAADYIFTSSGAGSLGSVAPLVKQGTGRLVLDVDNTMTGGTLIDGGILQIGGDSITPRGSLGIGNVTNNSGLVFTRSGTLTVSAAISGPAGITNNVLGGQNNVNNIIISGANTYTGVTEVNGGTWTLANNNALGNSPLVNVISTTGGANNGTRVSLSGGISTPAGTTISLPSLFDTVRSALFSAGSTGQTNTWNGPVVLNGNGNIAFSGGGGTIFVVAGNVSGPTFDGSAGNALQVRAVSGILSGTVNLPIGNVLLTDGVTWNIRPPTAGGNIWSNTIIASGTMQCGINNALPVGTTVTLGQSGSSGTLDLAGFNQAIAGLTVAAAAPANQTVTNSSVTADSTLAFNGITPSVFAGSINAGPRKLNLYVASSTLQLTSLTPLSLANSTVSITNGAVLQLDAATTNTVAALVLGPNIQPPGIYDSISGAPFITGAGSLLVPSATAGNPTNITFSVNGSTLTLSWPTDHLGWILQSQTNSIAVGIVNNANAWFDWPGSAAVTSTNVTINPADPTVFFRLRHP